MPLWLTLPCLLCLLADLTRFYRQLLLLHAPAALAHLPARWLASPAWLTYELSHARGGNDRQACVKRFALTKPYKRTVFPLLLQGLVHTSNMRNKGVLGGAVCSMCNTGGLCYAGHTGGHCVTHATQEWLLAVVVLWLVTSTGLHSRGQQTIAEHQQRPADNIRAPAEASRP